MGWFVINEEDGCVMSPLYSFIYISSRRYPKMLGSGYNAAFEIKRGHMRYLGNEDEFVETASRIYEKMEDRKFARELAKKTRNLCDEMDVFSASLLKLDVFKLTDAELAARFPAYYEKYDEMNSLGILYAIVEIRESHITNACEKMLSNKISEKGLPQPVGEYYAVLSSPTTESKAVQQEKDLLRMAAKKKNGGDIEEDIKQHLEKFGWVYYGYTGPALSKEKLLQQIEDEEKPAGHLQAINDRLEELKKKQHEYAKQLGLSEDEKALIQLARDAVELKARRKESMFYSFYALEPLQREVAKRAGYSLNAVRQAKADEIPLILEGKLHDELNERIKHFVFYADADSEKVLTGKKAEEFVKAVKEEDVSKASELRGQCGCPGKAKGTVRIVNTLEDMEKMREGDVLVSIATTPEIVPAMKKASAIVTNIGGLTCHAAIVSREMGIPCVIGTRIATKALKDGDLVEVNASEGIVRKL